MQKQKYQVIDNINEANRNYTLDNKSLATSMCIKDLGIWIDDKLKFHERTSATIAKANCILAIIKRSFNVNVNTFLRLYKAFFRPVLEYLNVVWGPTFLTHQRSLEKVKNEPLGWFLNCVICLILIVCTH